VKASPLPGEVWTVNFGIAVKHRRVLVVSIAAADCRLAISSVVQLSAQSDATPYEVTLPRVRWLPEQSYVNAQSVQPVKWIEFDRKCGQFDTVVLEAVRKALDSWLGISA
jgi:mRNA interferase MazF